MVQIRFRKPALSVAFMFRTPNNTKIGAIYTKQFSVLSGCHRIVFCCPNVLNENVRRRFEAELRTTGDKIMKARQKVKKLTETCRKNYGLKRAILFAIVEEIIFSKRKKNTR